MSVHFLAYGLLGWCAEIVWTAAYAAVERKREDWLRLEGHTYLWMLPIYGSCALLFEPAHDAMRAWPWPVRGLVYMVGIFAVEAVTGLLLRRFTGRCPWDYSYARWNVGGVIRLDYAPVWFAFGLGLERFHDLLLALHNCILQ